MSARRFVVKHDRCGCWAVYDRKDEFYYARFNNRLQARRHAGQKNKEAITSAARLDGAR